MKRTHTLILMSIILLTVGGGILYMYITVSQSPQSCVLGTFATPDADGIVYPGSPEDTYECYDNIAEMAATLTNGEVDLPMNTPNETAMEHFLAWLRDNQEVEIPTPPIVQPANN